MNANIPQQDDRSTQSAGQAAIKAKIKELAALRSALKRYHPNGDKQARRHERASQIISELLALGHPM